MKKNRTQKDTGNSTSFLVLLAATTLGSTPALHAQEDASASPAPGENDPRKELQAMIVANDANGDGYYSEAELLKLLETLQERRKTLRAQAEAQGHPIPDTRRRMPSAETGAARLMGRLDRDRDGLLSQQDVEAGIAMMRERVESLRGRRFSG